MKHNWGLLTAEVYKARGAWIGVCLICDDANVRGNSFTSVIWAMDMHARTVHPPPIAD